MPQRGSGPRRVCVVAGAVLLLLLAAALTVLAIAERLVGEELSRALRAPAATALFALLLLAAVLIGQGLRD